nr:Pycsar system effector family protein [Streptomyces viridosporus]
MTTLADHDLSAPTRALGTLAVAALDTAAVLLLLVVRPRLGGHDRASFPYWARLDETEVRDRLLCTGHRQAVHMMLDGIRVDRPAAHCLDRPAPRHRVRGG